jgi:hypothetical protein
MLNPSSATFKKMQPQEKLAYIRSIQTPTAAEISFLISILTDAQENAVIQAAVLPILKNAGEDGAAKLVLCFNQILVHEEETRIRLSYALSQLPKTPTVVFESFIKGPIPRIRQNGIIGLSSQNSGRYDALLYDILIHDPDSEVAFEAAAALEAGKERTLPLLKEILSNDLKNMQQENGVGLLEAHVLGKVIDIIGKDMDEEKIMYIEPYVRHENLKISTQAKEIIEKYKSGDE